MTDLVRSSPLSGRSLGPMTRGLAAQILTFAALAIPLVFAREDDIVKIVLITAIAAAPAQALSGAASTRMPGERSLRVVYENAACVLWSIAGTLFLALLVTAIAYGTFRGAESAAVAAFGALMAAAQASQIVLFALATRRSKIGRLQTARLSYGIVAAVGAAIVAALRWDAFAYIAASLLAYVACFATLLTRGDAASLAVSLRLSFRNSWRLRYYRQGSRLVLAAAMSGVSSQVPGLVVPLVGPTLAAPWSMAVRIVGGFQSLGVLVVGPTVDSRLGEAVRGQRWAEFRRTVRAGWLTGAGLAGAGLAACVAAIVVRSLVPDADQWALALGVFGLVAGAILPSPLFRGLGMSGSGGSRLVWDVFRLVSYATVVVVSREGWQVVAGCGLVGVAATMIFSVLLHRMAAQNRVVTTRGTDPQLAEGVDYDRRR